MVSASLRENLPPEQAQEDIVIMYSHCSHLGPLASCASNVCVYYVLHAFFRHCVRPRVSPPISFSQHQPRAVSLPCSSSSHSLFFAALPFAVICRSRDLSTSYDERIAASLDNCRFIRADDRDKFCIRADKRACTRARKLPRFIRGAK